MNSIDINPAQVPVLRPRRSVLGELAVHGCHLLLVTVLPEGMRSLSLT